MNYNEVIVVEGKNDQERISRLYPNALVITTNGSEVSEKTIDTLITLSKEHSIILLLDPDYPGERIRSLIQSRIPNVKHAFIKKDDAISSNKKKVGVEHALDSVIIKSLENLLTKSNKEDKITYSMLISIGLAGDSSSSILRNKISEHLNIGTPNAKSFLKRINMLDYDLEKLLNLMDIL